MVPKLPRHSFSRTKDFARICERRYAYDAIFGEWTGNYYTIRGGAIHDMYEQCLNGVVAGKTLDEACAAVKPKANEYICADELQGYLKRMRPILAGLKPREGGVEHRFSIDLGAKLLFSGVMDVVSDRMPIFDRWGDLVDFEERLCIIDWKSAKDESKVKWGKQTEFSIQLAAYCVAASILFEQPVRAGGFVFIFPHGEPKGVTTVLNEAHYQRQEHWLRTTLQVIDSRWDAAIGPDGEIDFDVFAMAEPGNGLCSRKWCPFYERCFGGKLKGSE